MTLSARFLQPGSLAALQQVRECVNGGGRIRVHNTDVRLPIWSPTKGNTLTVNGQTRIETLTYCTPKRSLTVNIYPETLITTAPAGVPTTATTATFWAQPASDYHFLYRNDREAATALGELLEDSDIHIGTARGSYERLLNVDWSGLRCGYRDAQGQAYYSLLNWQDMNMRTYFARVREFGPDKQTHTVQFALEELLS